MKSIFYTSSEASLNTIENFVDEICEEFNLSHSLYGNILISITESIKILEKFSTRGEISFQSDDKNLKFIFGNFTLISGVESIFERKEEYSDLGSDPEESIFMVNALSDDLIIDHKEKQIICIFKNDGLKTKMSEHRKEYLKNYLNQEVAANV